MDGRTVRVGGIPTDIPPERVADKLTIHFLRARNGGGEIADITLVAGSPACALVTFEEAGGNAGGEAGVLAPGSAWQAKLCPGVTGAGQEALHRGLEARAPPGALGPHPVG